MNKTNRFPKLPNSLLLQSKLFLATDDLGKLYIYNPYKSILNKKQLFKCITDAQWDTKSDNLILISDSNGELVLFDEIEFKVIYEFDRQPYAITTIAWVNSQSGSTSSNP